MQRHRNNSANSFTARGDFSNAWMATVFLVAMMICAPLNAEIVDRVVANVNGHAVLQSDWEQEIAFEGFSDARDPNSFSREERSAALDRLIDQELLREQLRPAQAAPSEQVVTRVAAIRKLHPNCETEAGWQSTLQRYGFTQGSIEKRIGDQILLMKLVDDRLRPSVQIDQQAVEAYYQEQLVPEMQRSGSIATPLTEVSGKIRALLAEKKLNELLTGWLASLRSTSRIMNSERGYGERSR
jgi:SurA N-terminal domain